MSTTTPHAQPNAPLPSLSEIGARTLDAVTAIAEANQRVIGRIIELSSEVATEPLRTLGALQSAAIEAARGAFAPASPRETLDELGQDPLAWYRKSVLSTLDGTQRVFKLLEANAQIVGRNAERLQGSAERTGKEIQEAVTACASRLRDLSSARA
jgi:crotonobetainyl-CoA:carnitine CoA-transferase CaiB-like acyl-CoA transferase